MNPTQFFLNWQGIKYIQKIENLIRLSLGRNRARPSCIVRVANAHGAALAHVCSVRGPWPRRWLSPCTARAAYGLPGQPRPVRPATRRCARAHAGAVTALRARIAARPVAMPQRRRWRKRRTSSTHDGEATRRAWGRGR
jgi:hypothetical protein